MLLTEYATMRFITIVQLPICTANKIMGITLFAVQDRAG
jgi:hypothetical protein